MYSYIPIIDLEQIDYTKITIRNRKILYDLEELNIKITASKILLSFNKDSIQIISLLLLRLREYVDELYTKSLSEEENKRLRSRPQYINLSLIHI
jgi:hypothetical protein